MALVLNWVSILISSKYLAITWEVYIVVGCALAHMYTMLGVYTHLVSWLCDLYMQCGSHIYSVIYSYMELMLYIELYIDNC